MIRGLRPPVAGWLLAVLATVPILDSGCTVDDGWFYKKVYSCDQQASGDACGKTADGRPMLCLNTTPLGGQDFCAEACDPAVPRPETDNFTCLTSGALVQRCHPNNKNGVDNCPEGLSCFRTDILLDEGICLKIDLCAENADCAGNSEHPVCAATILKQFSTLPFAFDHLQCVQATCKTSGTQCPPGFGCLANYFELGAEIPDICVPNCDGDLHCPPNYACARTPTAPGSPAVCLPGIPGTRCQADQDCIVGGCAQTESGFGVCTITLGSDCASDAVCGYLNAPTIQYACANTLQGRHCVATSPFRGTNCAHDTDCASGMVCFFASPFEPSTTHGECRVPCGADEQCPRRSGIPHTCLAHGNGGCFPGEFGLPCHASTDCIANFTCTRVAHDDRAVVDADSICTTSCKTDADCSSNLWIANGGYCEDGVCRTGYGKGVACDRGPQCFHGQCALAQDGVMRCVN